MRSLLKQLSLNSITRPKAAAAAYELLIARDKSIELHAAVAHSSLKGLRTLSTCSRLLLRHPPRIALITINAQKQQQQPKLIDIMYLCS
jgi:hypothetical protein